MSGNVGRQFLLDEPVRWEDVVGVLARSGTGVDIEESAVGERTEQ